MPKSKNKLTPEQHADIVGDFLEFSKYMFKEVTGSEFVINWHHRVICEHLERCLMGDINRLIINIPPRHSKCVNESSMVMTSKGYDQASNINVGDSVMSHIEGRLVKQNILGKESFTKESVKITTKTGREIEVSFDHPVLTQNGWKQAGELDEFDYLIRVNSIIDGDNRIPDAELDFITLMLFEGGCSDPKETTIRFSSIDNEVINVLYGACNNLGIKIKKYDYQAEFDFSVMGGRSGKAAALLREYGLSKHLAKHKRLPKQFFNMPLDQKYRFISLMIATDGYVVEKHGNLAICLASEGLIDDISLLLDTVGITAVKYYKKNDCAGAYELKIPPYQTKKIYNKLDCLQKQEKLNRIEYMVVKTGSTIGYPHDVAKGLTYKCKMLKPRIDFKNGKGIISYDKFERIANEVDPSIREKWTKQDFIYDKVKSVDNIGDRTVIHFEVDGDCYDNKNFICNGFVVHNTELAVVNFIAWSLGLFPDSEFIHASYSATLAENNSYNAKMLVEHESYKALFPNLKLRNDSNARNKWMTEQGGVIHAVGTGGSITGKGAGKMRKGFAGAIIIDDPIKVNDAQSDTVRPKVNEWFSSVMESRLNKKDTPIIVIMQRLHEDDLSGFLLNGGNGEEWVHLKIPSINEKGEALWPFKHTIDDLRRREKKNPYMFSGQHMQNPSPQGGGIFKEAWLNWYVSHMLPEMKYTFITADTALKTKEHNDYSVIQHWGYGVDNNLYLLNMRRGKWESQDLDTEFAKFFALCSSKYKIKCCYIEDKASGTGLIQKIKRDASAPVQAVQRGAGSDKVFRSSEVATWVNMGKVYLNKEIDQIDQMVSEITTFPVGRHDDTVDAFMDALDIAYNKAQGNASVSYGSIDSSDDNNTSKRKRYGVSYG